jgi:hypothetical protein
MRENGAQPEFRVVEPADVDDVFVAKWKALSDSAIEPNPYHDPRFVLPSVRLREEARCLRLAVVEDADRLRAAMVFTVNKLVPRAPIMAVTTGGPFMAHVSEMVCHPLVGPIDPVETWTCLLRGLGRAHLPGLLVLKNFPATGALRHSLLSAAGVLSLPLLARNPGQRAFARTVAGDSLSSAHPEDPIPVTITVPHGSSSSERHRARQRRAIENATGGPLTIEDRGHLDETASHYLDLELAGWKGDPARGGRALRLSGHDDWFLSVASAFRADHRLSVEVLTGGQETVYMGVNIRAGNGMFGFVDTYNELFARNGAGTLGRIASVHHALGRRDVTFFDPNVDARYPEVTRVFPHRQPHETIVLGLGGLRSRAFIAGVPVGEGLRRVAATRTPIISTRAKVARAQSDLRPGRIDAREA